MSKKVNQEITEVKVEPVDQVQTEVAEVCQEEMEVKKLGFFKRHWKKIAGIGAAVTAVGGIVFLATRKLHHEDAEENDFDYEAALKAITEAASETITGATESAVEAVGETTEC